MFAQPDQYCQLTQSYVQKSFTIFNLIVSVSLLNDADKLPMVSHGVSNTQNELIETHLNIKYLLLCQSMKKPICTHDFTLYEVELARFVARNSKISDSISQLLPSLTHLYYIIEHKRDFYPFGVIKAYKILGLVISADDAFQRNSELTRIPIESLMDVMASTSDEEDVDEVIDSMWQFIAAHLSHCQLHSSHITTEQIRYIISHLRTTTQPYKSSSLRQTATDIFSIISPYFKESSDLELLIEFSELLLSLLRDDDVYVRNRTSDIVMDLVHGNQECYEKGNSSKIYKKINDFSIHILFTQVIPLAAEDHLLQWLDSKFIEIAKHDAWSKWLDLLRLVHAPLKENDTGNITSNGSDEDSHLVDVDIFDDTEPNTFDETVYTNYKCYKFLIKHIGAATLDVSQKEKILSEFSSLKNL